MITFDYVARSTSGQAQSGQTAYVLAPNGPLDRAPDLSGLEGGAKDAAIAAFLADETLITGYTDATVGTEIVQPLLSDSEGRYTRDSALHSFPAAFFATRSSGYDVYSPDDTINPIVRWAEGGGDDRSILELEGLVDDGDWSPVFIAAGVLGGTWHVPAGLYNVSGLLNWTAPTRVKFVGAGCGSRDEPIDSETMTILDGGWESEVGEETTSGLTNRKINPLERFEIEGVHFQNSRYAWFSPPSNEGLDPGDYQRSAFIRFADVSCSNSFGLLFAVNGDETEVSTLILNGVESWDCIRGPDIPSAFIGAAWADEVVSRDIGFSNVGSTVVAPNVPVALRIGRDGFQEPDRRTFIYVGRVLGDNIRGKDGAGGVQLFGEYVNVGSVSMRDLVSDTGVDNEGFYCKATKGNVDKVVCHNAGGTDASVTIKGKTLDELLLYKEEGGDIPDASLGYGINVSECVVTCDDDIDREIGGVIARGSHVVFDQIQTFNLTGYGFLVADGPRSGCHARHVTCHRHRGQHGVRIEGEGEQHSAHVVMRDYIGDFGGNQTITAALAKVGTEDAVQRDIEIAGSVIFNQAEAWVATHDALTGTWTWTVSGQTTSALSATITPAALETALAGLSTVSDDVAVTGVPTHVRQAWRRIAFDTDQATALTSTIGVVSLPYDPYQFDIRYSNVTGTFDVAVTVGGVTQTAAGLAWDISNADLKAAIEALSNVLGTVTITGTGVPVVIDGWWTARFPSDNPTTITLGTGSLDDTTNDVSQQARRGVVLNPVAAGSSIEGVRISLDVEGAHSGYKIDRNAEGTVSNVITDGGRLRDCNENLVNWAAIDGASGYYSPADGAVEQIGALHTPIAVFPLPTYTLDLTSVTAGTLTLTVNAQTTGSIAFDAADRPEDVPDGTSFEEKLLALSTVDVVSARRVGEIVTIELSGLLADTQPTVSGSFGSLTGGSPSITAAVPSTLTLDETYEVILSNAAYSNFTATLPPVATCKGRCYTIKKVDSSANTVTLDGDGTETIDGATTVVLTAEDDYVSVIGDSARWRVIGMNP